MTIRMRWKQFWCNHDWIEFYGINDISLRLCHKCLKDQYARYSPELDRHLWRRYL